MQNYNEFLDNAGVSQKVMIQILRQYFPSFTKSICSIVMRPKKYGVSLCPEAEAVLVDVFGPGPGLARPDIDVELPQPRRKENRKKGNRVTVWMNDDLYLRLVSLKTSEEFPTMTALVERAIREFIYRNTQEWLE